MQQHLPLSTATACRFFVVSIALLFASPTSVCNAATLSDATFANGDWTLSIFTRNAGGAINANQDIATGNPLPSRFLRQQVNPVNGGGDSIVAGFHLKSQGLDPAIIDPKLCPIDTLDWSLDYLNPSIGNVAIGVAVEQGGKFYTSFVGGGPTGNSFSTIGQLGLSSNDFDEVSATTVPFVDPLSHPDFSASGAPLTFGFYTANSTFGGGYSRDYWVDNWSVTITKVPEPASFGLFAAVGALGWASRFRRR